MKKTLTKKLALAIPMIVISSIAMACHSTLALGKVTQISSTSNSRCTVGSNGGVVCNKV